MSKRDALKQDAPARALTIHDLPWELVDVLADLAPRLTFTCRAWSRLLTEERRYQLLIDNGGSIRISCMDIEWKLNNRLHRRHGPAAEYTTNGYVRWWMIDGVVTRLDGPAYEDSGGQREWRVNGLFHRLDGPAIERANGQKEWWVNGKRHRSDGPAIIRPNGGCLWIVDGRLMRAPSRRKV